MNPTLKIIKHDIQLIFRDKSLVAMFIAPVAIVLLCRFGIPKLENTIPALSEYYWLIVASFASVAAAMPSFLFGFILLDERDENIHILLKILPLPENYILKCRVVLMMFLGFIFSLFILTLNGIFHINFFQMILVSFQFALIPPILTFSIAAFAKNKIEATTMYKGLTIVLVLPVFAFFVNGSLKYLFGIIPFFWTFNSINFLHKPVIFMLNMCFSIVSHLMLTYFLYRLYQKKMV